ncbi:hypothetical protein ACSBR1_001158 [Camellia fascicularis]
MSIICVRIWVILEFLDKVYPGSVTGRKQRNLPSRCLLEKLLLVRNFLERCKIWI